LGLWDEADGGETEDSAVWEKAVGLFEGGCFEMAEEAFSFLANKRPENYTAKLYADRCMKYLRSPPPEGRDGAHNLTEK
jgi:hypothetical protein